MLTLLFQEVGEHSIGFVFAAALICAVTSITAAMLLRRLQEVQGRARLGYAALLAAIAGVGVWTTHFVAMLGYRPDLLIGFDPSLTGFSALVSLMLVGGPLAFSGFLRARRNRMIAGGIAGAGVGAMHYTGMMALEGCVATYTLPTVVFSFGIGIGAFAAALGLGKWNGSGIARAGLLILGVCGLHFTGMLAASLEPTAVSSDARDVRAIVSALIALASVTLFVAGAVAVVSTRRVELQRRFAAETEARQNRDFSTALRNMSNGLLMLDAAGRVSIFNDRVVELFRLQEEDLSVGMGFGTVLSGIALRNGWSQERLQLAVETQSAWMRQELKQRSEIQFDDGRVLSVAFSRVSDGGAIITFDDQTEYRAVERAARHAAYHDGLTGLPNRDSFRQEVEALVAAGGMAGLLMLDLDRFKSVNEILGEAVGDAVLIKVSARLRATLGPGDAAFRLGGDELAVIIRGEDVVTVLHMAERIRASFDEPLMIGGNTVSLSCSAGLALTEAGESADYLVQRADLTLYRAKELRHDRVELYEDGLMEQAVERRETERDLRRALSQGEFSLNFQPLHELPSRDLMGFEALIRWEHPTKGMISPAHFIPLAERNGMIHEIGAWVLDTACRQAAGWPEHIHLAVNVSAVQMRSPDIVVIVREALKRHGITPSRLELELTETAMVEDGHQISQTLCALRALGVGIAMDDFGTGYSSLTHLRDFELDRIKIDRSFVDTEDSDLGARAVIRAVTSMAKDLSILTIGEGVETDEQLERLISLGCDAAQGYLLGRPLQAEAADRLVSASAFEADAGLEAIRPTGT